MRRGNIDFDSYLNKLNDLIRAEDNYYNDVAYHYTSIESFFNIINSNNVFCSNINFMNDSDEFEVFFKLVDKVIRNFRWKSVKEKKDTEWLIDDIREVIVKNKDMFKQTVYVLSLCKEYDSIPMWRNYADSSGICFGVNYKKVVDLFNNQPFITAYPVIYEEEKQINILNDIIRYCVDDFNNLRAQAIQKENGNEVLAIIKLNKEYIANRYRIKMMVILYILASTFKDASFKYENEVRIIILNKMVLEYPGEKITSEMNIGYRAIKDAIIRYTELDFKENKIPIENRIIISPLNNNSEGKNSILGYLLHKGYNVSLEPKSKNILIDKSNLSLKF